MYVFLKALTNFEIYYICSAGNTILRLVRIAYMLKLFFGEYSLFKCLFHSKQYLESVFSKLVSFLLVYCGIKNFFFGWHI